VALPVVMQVTMAVGAKNMADQKAIVTHLTALQVQHYANLDECFDFKPARIRLESRCTDGKEVEQGHFGVCLCFRTSPR
jgi:transcription-repair coupling factor (superfamily II helicase)